MIYPTVTETIAPWTDFSKIPTSVLNCASERGTKVHDLCAKIAMGSFVVPDLESALYVLSFRKWFDLMIKEVIMVESRLSHAKWGYSGQLDLLCRLKDGRIALIDEKTPVALSKSWRPQLAAYWELCSHNGHEVDCCGSLRLSPHGKMAKMKWYENQTEDFNIFVQCLNVYRYFNS